MHIHTKKLTGSTLYAHANVCARHSCYMISVKPQFHVLFMKITPLKKCSRHGEDNNLEASVQGLIDQPLITIPLLKQLGYCHDIRCFVLLLRRISAVSPVTSVQITARSSSKGPGCYNLIARCNNVLNIQKEEFRVL